MNIVEKIKRDNKPSLKELFLSSYLISQRISPYFSSMYIKRKVVPNKITLHMIYSGIIGAILFSLPNIYLKIIGAIFIHLWFILDCSDGEVARYTKTFSKYGKELDYMAHLINHPLFGLAMFISLMQLGRYNMYVLLIVVFASNFMDYGARNLFTLKIVYELKQEKDANNINNKNKWTIKKAISFVISIFTLYPNIILFGVIIYFIDYFLGSNILFTYIIMNVLFTTVLFIKDMLYLTRTFYKS